MNKLSKYLLNTGMEKTAIIGKILGINRDPVYVNRLQKGLAGKSIESLTDSLGWLWDTAQSHEITERLHAVAAMPKHPYAPSMTHGVGLAEGMKDRYDQLAAKLHISDQNKKSLKASYAFGNKDQNPYAALKDAIRLKNDKFGFKNSIGGTEFVNMSEALRHQALLGIKAVTEKHHDDDTVRDFAHRFEKALGDGNKKSRKWADDILDGYARQLKDAKTPTLTIFTQGPNKKVYLKENLALPFDVGNKGVKLDLTVPMEDLRKHLTSGLTNAGSSQVKDFKKYFGKAIQQGELAMGDLDTVHKIETFFNTAPIKRALDDAAGGNTLLTGNQRPITDRIVAKVKNKVMYHGGAADKALLEVLQEAAADPAEARVLEVLRLKHMDKDTAKDMVSNVMDVGQKARNELSRVGLDAVGTAAAVPVIGGIPYLLYRSRKNRKEKSEEYNKLVGGGTQ